MSSRIGLLPYQFFCPWCDGFVTSSRPFLAVISCVPQRFVSFPMIGKKDSGPGWRGEGSRIEKPTSSCEQLVKKSAARRRKLGKSRCRGRFGRACREFALRRGFFLPSRLIFETTRGSQPPPCRPWIRLRCPCNSSPCAKASCRARRIKPSWTPLRPIFKV